MSNVIPPARPRLSKEKAIEIFKSKTSLTTPFVLAIRGYYEDTMGKNDVNDIGIYDDAMFLVEPLGNVFIPCNANTDPSKLRLPVYGYRIVNGKRKRVKIKNGMATLKPGLYFAEKHRHRSKYPALQLTNPHVTRDGDDDDHGRQIGINIHYGDDLTDGIWKGTWSEGCQTIPKSQWLGFQQMAYRLMDKYEMPNIPYLLIDNNQNKYI